MIGMSFGFAEKFQERPDLDLSPDLESNEKHLRSSRPSLKLSHCLEYPNHDLVLPSPPFFHIWKPTSLNNAHTLILTEFM